MEYGVGISLTLPVVLATALWWFQRRLIYPADFPEGSRTLVPKPTDAAMPYEDVTLTTSDGLKIKAYFIPARERVVPLHELRGLGTSQLKERGEVETKAWDDVKDTKDAIEYAQSRPTILMFHANAGNLGHRIPLARKFVSELGCNVFMLSYRGYGLSEGSPSEAGIKIDAVAAMEFIATHPILSKTKLILYGQSIGGAIALDTAAAFPDQVSGVIIENTFLSLETLVPHVMPALPQLLVSLLLSEHWDATKSMPKIPKSTPMLFLSGKRDELVPQAQMIQLRKLRGEGKARWHEFADGTHNDTYVVPEYWLAIQDWLEDEVIGASKEKL